MCMLAYLGLQQVCQGLCCCCSVAVTVCGFDRCCHLLLQALCHTCAQPSLDLATSRL